MKSPDGDGVYVRRRDDKVYVSFGCAGGTNDAALRDERSAQEELREEMERV